MLRLNASILLMCSCVAVAQVRENKPIVVTVPSLVGYGVGVKWVAKLLPAGTHICSNKLFGDPVYGVVKSCVSYPVNAAVCGLEAGANTDASVTATGGAWLSHWCPTTTGLALHVLAGTLPGTYMAAECYAKAQGSSVQRLAKCAPGDVTNPDLAAIWSGSATRIFNTRPK
jgi:hypothetical protein